LQYRLHVVFSTRWAWKEIGSEVHRGRSKDVRLEEKEMRQSDLMTMRGQAIRSNSTPSWIATQCRVITYIAAVMPLLLIIVLAGLYPHLNRANISDWRSLISLADEASNSGDRYEARRLYLQADRIAYWRKDWEGLIVAACRINKLDGAGRPSAKAVSILFRASTTAEQAQSYRGLATAALALSMLGSDAAAAAIVSRAQAHWPNDPVRSEDLALLAGCSRLP
jgi:hypothetical protein